MIPPHNLDAEAAVIGASLSEIPAREHALGALTPDDFYDVQHREIYRAIVQLHGHGHAVDPVSLAATMHAAGSLEGVGGRRRLLSLQAETPLASNARTYVGLVADCAARRRIMDLAEATISKAGDPAEDIGQLVAGLERSAETVRLPHDEVVAPIDAADLTAEQDDYDWLVPKLIERGDRVILTAAEGVGKSTALRSWAVMLAAGIHPFHLYSIHPLRVLLVDLENSRRQIRRSLQGLLANAGTRYQGGLGVESWISGIDVRNARDFRRLDRLCELHRPDVVVIGPLYKAFRVHGRESKTDETAAEEAAYAFDRLRARHGCALLIEAHSPHGEGGDRAGFRPYGASLWLRWPEFGIGMKRISGEKAVELKHWRGARDRDREWPETLYEGRHWPWEAPIDERSVA